MPAESQGSNWVSVLIATALAALSLSRAICTSIALAPANRRAVARSIAYGATAGEGVGVGVGSAVALIDDTEGARAATRRRAATAFCFIGSLRPGPADRQREGW